MIDMGIESMSGWNSDDIRWRMQGNLKVDFEDFLV